MASNEVPDDRNVGRVVAGKFQIDAVLGVGNGGMVYRATHLQLRRPVAIKTMRASIAADPTAVARFEREAQLASQLDHPNVVHVFDYGTEPDGLTYIAMELLDGRTLTRVMRDEAPLGVERIVQLLSQVLAAAAAAHRLGIVHRDLKPDNIMLVTRAGDDGNAVESVKVADFGMAKAFAGPAHGGEAITTFGMVGGTPEYMSPEQAQGLELDGRSDLYAVGVILYEMLAGALPFGGETPIAVLNKHVNSAVPAPSTRREGVDPRLEQLALRALSKAPDARFADAAAMRAELLRVADEDAPSVTLGTVDSVVVAQPPVVSATVPAVPRALAPRVAPRSNARFIALLAAAVAVAVVLVAVVAMSLRGGPEPERANSVVAQDADDAGEAGAALDGAGARAPRRVFPRAFMRRPGAVLRPMHGQPRPAR